MDGTESTDGADLARALRALSPRATQPTPAGHAHPNTDAGPSATAYEGGLGRPGFVGRTAELARLAELLFPPASRQRAPTAPGQGPAQGPGRREPLPVAAHDCPAAAPAVAVVEGPAGIGKSSLLREFGRLAGQRGARVLWGQAGEFEQAVPFGPFLDVMSALGADLTGPVSAAAGAGFPGSAHPADNGTGDIAPAPSSPVPTGIEQHRLYRRFRDALGAEARKRPVALVLDDVHWADDASIGLLEFLALRPVNAPVALVVSFRSGRCPPRLARALGTAAAAPTRVRVPPLAQEDVDRLLPGVRPDHRRALAEASAGNPLYLLLLAALPAHVVAALDAPTPALDDEAARLLDDTISAELGLLPERERLVARAAAVGGREVDAHLVAAIAELPEPDVLSALDELTARSIVTARRAGFAFTHPLLRAAAYRLSGHGWRISAHRRAAEHLARTGAPTMLRAQHLEHALHRGDVAAAADLAEAARVALAFAPATSARWLSLALDIIPGTGHQETVTRLRLLLGRALLASGELERASAVLRELPARSPRPRREALALLAQCERILGRPRTAYALLASEASSGGPAVGPIVVELATLDLMDGQIETGIRRARQLTGAADPATRAAATVLLALGAVGRGDSSAAAAGLAEADARLDALDDGELRTILDAVLPAFAWAAYLTERHTRALHHLDRGIRVARVHGHSYALPHLYAAQACALTRLGRLHEAIEAAQDAEQHAAAFGASDMLAIAASVKLRSMLWISGPDAVRDPWRTASELPEPVSQWFRMSVATILIDVGLQMGAAPEPASVARLGLGLGSGGTAGGADFAVRAPADAPLSGDGAQNDPMLATRCAQAAETALAFGRVEEARAWLREAERTGAAWNLPGQFGTIRLVRARLFTTAGDTAAVLRECLAAADDFGRAGMPIQQGAAYLEAARAAGLLGDTDLAGTHIAAARERFAGAGAAWLDSAALREQRRLAARRPRHRAADQELSARELQVAELVAQGLSNRAIGERLHLSPRTVESHLGRILTKLGVSSRAGVARRLPAAGLPG